MITVECKILLNGSYDDTLSRIECLKFVSSKITRNLEDIIEVESSCKYSDNLAYEGKDILKILRKV